jgi:GT2 family glycosyltransferase
MRDIVDAYQEGYERSTADILAHIHDDLKILEPDWDKRVMKEFENPEVALVGFAGAPQHGVDGMYDRPFDIGTMIRLGFTSNLVNAEQHGARYAGEMNATILDGLAFFVRRSFLDEIGGWPTSTVISYFMYMEWLCCMVRRQKKRIRMVGVRCDHLGGRSTGRNPNLRIDFEGEHRFIYEAFRDVMPGMVEP